MVGHESLPMTGSTTPFTGFIQGDDDADADADDFVAAALSSETDKQGAIDSLDAAMDSIR